MSASFPTRPAILGGALDVREIAADSLAQRVEFDEGTQLMPKFQEAGAMLTA